MVKRKRIKIPYEIAARVLFLSDRTCCVCRIGNKPIQIHHIDENPENNEIPNLCVLCFDCHRETQIRGGFDRKLDSDQLILYRDDWLRIVSKKRIALLNQQKNVLSEDVKDKIKIKEVTTLAEIYREYGDWGSLAKLYHLSENYELRDKYIELAVQNPSWDQEVWYLRGIQGRVDLIPKELIQREIKRLSEEPDYLQRARLFCTLGRYLDAALDYAVGITKVLEEKNWFTAAFYLKEMIESKLIEHLFIEASREASEKGELWWQIRALQELGWQKELTELMRKHQSEIEKSDDLHLSEILADALGDANKAFEIKKKIGKIGYPIPLSFPTHTALKGKT
jgi:hypothetical protein